MLLIIIISIWIGIGLWEITIVYTYQTSMNKTSYENDACSLTIIRLIINILNGINILCVYNLKKKDNIYWNTLVGYMILINIVTYIINVSLFTNLKKYGVFIPVILLEFIMYMITMSIVVLLLFISYVGIINNNELLYIPQIAVRVDNIEIADVNIPEFVVDIDITNVNITDVNIPQATPIIFIN